MRRTPTEIATLLMRQSPTHTTKKVVKRHTVSTVIVTLAKAMYHPHNIRHTNKISTT